MLTIFILAALGFLAGLAVHLLAFTGAVPVSLSTAFALFFPALIVAGALNALIVLKRRREYVHLPRGEFWYFMTRRAPAWMRSLQVAFLLYVLFNYILTMVIVNRGGFPRIMDGRYYLMSYRDILEELTQREYLRHAAYAVRMLSSMLMAVYFSALTRWVSGWVSPTTQTGREPAPPAEILPRNP